MSFVHLHNHSQYSILDASSSIAGIAEHAAKFNMPAVALTDHGNLYGAVDFYKACKEQKVKALIGCEFYVAPDSRLEKKKTYGVRTAYHLVLLAKNKTGYHNLCKLSSSGFIEGFYYNPRIDNELLKQHSEGLVCLSGCINSLVAQEVIGGKLESALETIRWHHELFGEDYYLELQRHQMSEQDLVKDDMYQESWLHQQYQDYIAQQQKVNDFLIKTSKELGIRLVATNDCHYLEREDWKAHEIQLNVQSGEPCEIWEKDSQGNPKFRVPNPKRETYRSHEYYFKSIEQMHALFSDLPEALAATLEITDKCDVEMDFKTKHYPVYIPPALEGKKWEKEDQAKAVEEYLWQLCEKGIPNRYTPERLEKVKEQFPDKDPMEIVRERLNYEMNIIVPKGMADYLLIVWDFIHWAKSNGIPMGPGRGSGAGSIVLYLIGITDIEPLRFHLFFERFINPERLSYPDIDVDICMDKRNKVIEYTLHKYGSSNIAQIITFGTMKAKMAIKDVGRVLSVPLAKVNIIAKFVPDDLNITLEKALEKDPDLKAMYEQDEDAQRIIDIGRRLEGSIRNTGIHAAGIIICGDPLTDHIPICKAKDSDMSVTQYSMKPVEMVGMLKVDFLGLKNLTCIQVCVDAIKAAHGIEIDWINLPLDDKPTFDLLNQGKTMGVFQLESGGMQDLARHLHLDKFEEIIAVGALYRPGPMDMIPSFINRKHGREPIENDHPWMKEILAETYGIMVYQEQVMQIASKLANYTLGEGDVLRRAMGKKDMNEMAKQREKFRLGALANGIDEEISMRIFDKMEKFAAYGFNKSHAAAYAYLSYVTSYLKANYTKEWLAALMTCDKDDLSKVVKFIRECQALGIEVLPPDINEAGDTFVATSKGIRFAMSGIKGIGSGVVEAIVEERNKAGPFTSLYQFIKRVDTKKIGKKAIESLVEAGCFDFTGWTRDALRQSVEPMYDTASKDQKEAAQGMMSLFSALGDESEKRFSTSPNVIHKSSAQQILFKEKELLGIFLTGHPMDGHRELIQRLCCIPFSRLEEMNHDTVFRAAFLVETIDIKHSSKTQKKFAILSISDGYERWELPVWPELFEKKGHLLKENQLLYAVMQVDKREEEMKLSCRWFEDLTQANQEMIDECDRIFDKTKHAIARAVVMRTQDNGKKNETKEIPNQNKPKVEDTMKEEKLELSIELSTLKLSHVISLKGIFEEHRGEMPVQVHYKVDGKLHATLHIDKPWGVKPSPQLTELLKQKGFIQ